MLIWPERVDENMTSLITIAARKGLRGKKTVSYWRIRRARYIGYLCSPSAPEGSWYALTILKNGRHRVKVLGRADDSAPSNGVDFIDFYQALHRAELWFDAQREDAVPDILSIHLDEPFPNVPPPPPYTVANAVCDYLKWYRENRNNYRPIFYNLRSHVMGQLGHIPLAELTTVQIEEWRSNLSRSAPIIPTGRSGPLRYGPRLDDPEWLRKRRYFSNQILTNLKMVLNRAFDLGFVESDRAWARVKGYTRVRSVHEPLHLTIEQVRCLLDASTPWVANVIKGGLSTGCRISDLIKMQVCDYKPDLGRINVIAQKTKRFYHVTLSVEGAEFFDRLVRGRPESQHMFLNRVGQPWRYQTFRKGFVKAQEDAHFAPTFNFHRLDVTPCLSSFIS